MTSATTLGINRAKLWLSVMVGLSMLLPAAPRAATGTLSPQPYITVFDSNGDPISGACVWTYQAGTTTPVNTYTDVALATPNSNPIIADSAGRFVAYLTPGQSYKFIFEGACTPPAHGTTVKTSDNISATPTSSAGVDVLATAGEALTAGNAVYLSDGSGGKTQGSWYKADTGNLYSSTLPLIGVVPASISSATVGTVRISGQVTGLSSLTVGADYYVSTSGAITSTVPATRRWIGRADTTSTLVVSGNPPPTIAFFPVVNDFRLTLTTAVPVTTTDVTAATTLFWSPLIGNRVTLAIDATGTLEICTTTEKSIAVPATTSQVYSVWVFDTSFGGCTLSLELQAWTNDTTPGTGATARTTTGFPTKSGDTTRRFVGLMRTTTVSGQTEDSVTSRYVWNAYNQKDRPLQRLETTTSWTYASTTIRQANAAAANQVNFVSMNEDPIEAQVGVTSSFATASQSPIVGLGLDSTTTFASNQLLTTVEGVAGIGSMQRSHYTGFPGAGKHSLMWNEAVTAATTTFYSNTATINAVATGGNFQSGIIGKIKG